VILPSISRDGSKIVFRRQFDFYSFDTSSKKSSQIDIWYSEDVSLQKDKLVHSSSTSDLDVSSDGLEFVFTSGFDIWAMDKILKEPIRITRTAEVEKEVLFSKDNNSIYCIRDDGVGTQLIQIDKKEKLYWWQSHHFKETVLFNSDQNINNLKLSPKGNYLSYVKGNGDLYTYNLKSKEERLFLKSWDAPMYSWSPDEKWISYALEDNNFNNDVWLKSLDGKQEAYNVSQHPEYDGYPVFSPDGKFLAFSTNRNDEGYEIAYVTLSKENYEESSRDRQLEKALKEMKKRKVAKKPKAEEKTPKEPVKEEKEAKAEKVIVKKDEDEGILVDLEDLTKRVKIIKNAGDDYAPFWAPDGKRLAFKNTRSTKTTIQFVTLPDNLKPALLYKESLNFVKWLKENDQLYCSVRKSPAMISKGKVNTYLFRISYTESRRTLNKNIFRHIWRMMKDHFYDDKMNNKDWDQTLQKYEMQAELAPDEKVFDRIVAMLLGELNASHLGFRSVFKDFSADNSHEITAHLGVKFDENFKGPGLKISEVIDGSNAEKEDRRLFVGDIILQIDGEDCDIEKDLTVFLNGRLKRDIVLNVKGKDSEREVKIRPHSYSEIRSLLYNQQMEKRKAVVRAKGNGKMGYLHVSSMLWPEFNKFKEEVYKEGNGRDGLVIDVRNNGGGFTADHLISVLTQPRHAITVPRNGGPGYPFSRQVYLNWYKPIVVLCNQNSYSNAEIFTHAIKSLKRGKVIGVPTAGGVISTGAVGILGKGTLRIPFRGWYISGSGEDMEMNGAVPDIVIWPLPGELENGKDVQLEKAIEVLSEEIKDFEDLNKVKLKKASER
ncbi:MAG: S41 family peptidase, partial [Lentisphaeraceae bacterium]|nr:S41 family peptidase [Lentisphaeraceae bacterium]